MSRLVHSRYCQSCSLGGRSDAASGCIGADFHSAVVATAPGELDPPYDINLVFMHKLHLFLGKSTKTAATRAALFDSSMHTKSFVGWASPQTTLGELTALPRPLSCI